MIFIVEHCISFPRKQENPFCIPVPGGREREETGMRCNATLLIAINHRDCASRSKRLNGCLKKCTRSFFRFASSNDGVEIDNANRNECTSSAAIHLLAINAGDKARTIYKKFRFHHFCTPNFFYCPWKTEHEKIYRSGDTERTEFHYRLSVSFILKLIYFSN